MKIPWLCLVLSILLAAVAQAQPVGADTQEKLTLKQADIHARMQSVERTIERLITSLRLKEPQNAQRLQQALQKIRQKDLSGRMAEIRLLFKQGQIDQALTAQQRLITCLQGIIQDLMLTKAPLPATPNTPGSQPLQKLQSLIKEQQQEYQHWRSLSRQAELVQSLQAWQGRLRQLQQAQKKLVRASRDLRDQLTRQALLSRQQQLQQQTAALSGQMQQAAAQMSAIASSRGQAARSMTQTARSMAQAARSMTQATRSMTQAVKDLAHNAPARVVTPSQKRASSQISQALQLLDTHLVQLKAQNTSSHEAGQQQRLRQRTAALATSLQVPGHVAQALKPHLNAAEQAMRLVEKNSRQAQWERCAREAARALDNLQKARESLQDVMTRSRSTKAPVAAWRRRLGKILARQRALHERLRRLPAQQPHWDRAQQLNMHRLAREQIKLARALPQITSCPNFPTDTLLPQILDLAATDMHSVAQRLRAYQPDAVTRELSQNIIALLEELYKAPQNKDRRAPADQAQDKADSAGNQAGSSPSTRFSVALQLKLIHGLQARLNQLTRLCEQQVPLSQRSRCHAVLATQQRRIATLTEQLAQILAREKVK